MLTWVGAQDSPSDVSEDGSDNEEDEDNDSEAFGTATMEVDPHSEAIAGRDNTPSALVPPPEGKVLYFGHYPRLTMLPVPPPLTRKRSLSPAQVRKKTLVAPIGKQVPSGSYTVEAISALPHPVPTHALASSLCMTHLLTGSNDGYIRDYDVFAAVNSKIFLTAPQRHHSGVVEGIMKSGQLRFWWENPVLPDASKIGGMPGMVMQPPGLSPVYSLAMHSDALWTLAGTDVCPLTFVRDFFCTHSK